jgi:outer membrane protein
MHKQKGYLFGGFFAVVLATALFFGLRTQTEKTAFINMEKVYNEFELTQELTAKLTEVAGKRQSVLDSMEVQLVQLRKVIEQGNRDEQVYSSYRQLSEQFQYKQQSFAQDNEALSREYDQQVMKQLNQYIREFGEEKGYTFIYGANGNGSLMFAKDEKDISEPVISFVNNKYQGKK